MNVEVDKPWLMLGDCLERMKEIPDSSVDMVLSDLPYSMTACKWDSPIDLDSLWTHYDRILKKDAVIALTANQPFSSRLVMSKADLFRHSWIWEKNASSGHLNAKRKPMLAHDEVLIFGGKRYFPQMDKGEPYIWDSKGTKRECYGKHGDRRIVNNGERFPRSVLKFRNERGLHSTQKPVPLFEYMIRTYSLPNEIVLDNCFGSGTAGVACVNTGRKFIGIESNEGFFDLGKRRIEKAIFDNGAKALDAQPCQESLIHAR